MATCPMCNARKGKRSCLIASGPVCSLCCGTNRKRELCAGCQFYQEPKRRYGDVPAFTVSEMDNDMGLQAHGNAIEGALCAYDLDSGNMMRDRDAIKIIEALIDVFHFLDDQVLVKGELVANGVTYVGNVIREDLKGIDKETINKVLGVIWFVANRRTRMGREYLDVIRRHVGPRIGTGVRQIML